MVQHFLKYWLYSTVQHQLEIGNAMLDHSASDQYDHAQIGDHVWFVTMPPKTRRLFLFGHMEIGWMGTQDEAAVRLGEQPEDLWAAQFHILPRKGREEFIDPVEITGIAAELTFISPTNRNRLQLKNGGINPQSLQTMRVIHPDSVQILEEIWYTDADSRLSETTDDIPPNLVVSEGKKKLYSHFRRERNQRIVTQAKARFKEAHGKLYCEACMTDFSQLYGELGRDFIEAHHKIPLSSLGDDSIETSINDLVMLCANCHRMIHRRKPWLSFDELVGILDLNKQHRVNHD